MLIKCQNLLCKSSKILILVQRVQLSYIFFKNIYYADILHMKAYNQYTLKIKS